MALDAGLKVTDIRMNDRTQYLIPPYATASERSILEEYQEWLEQERMNDEDRKWFTENILEGGGTQSDADAYIALTEGHEFKQTVRRLLHDGKYVNLSGQLMYLTFARKSMT
jgi:hypothetical protein